jgi:hypothetical protein
MKVNEQFQSFLKFEGAEEMMQLLTSLSLQKYAPLFLQEEVDVKAFMQLTDTDLSRMGINLVGPRVKILQEIARLREEKQMPMLLPPSASYLPIDDNSMWSISSLESFLTPMIPEEEEFPSAKKRKLIELNTMSQKDMAVYVYLANIVAGKNSLKKILFMVKSMRDPRETESIVQKIQAEIVSNLITQGKNVLDVGKLAECMLFLKPDANGDWQARSNGDRVWSFKNGDFIKIDNHHSIDIGISVHHFFIPSEGETEYVEDARSPSKYPMLFPGGSLEIGLDENKDSRLALAAELDSDSSETFAVTRNGRLLFDNSNIYGDSCIFSFKRRRADMRKIASLDDFQKELFLSRCLDPTCI